MLTIEDARQVCKPAISKDSHRVALTDYALSRNCETAYLVATDTHRLHIAQIELADAPIEPNTLVALADASVPFPNWERVTPTLFTREFEFKAAASLEAAVKAVMHAAKLNADRVRLTFKDQTCIVWASCDAGIEVEARARCEYAESNEGYSMAFNGKYVIDAIAAHKVIGRSFLLKPVTLRCTENSRPAVFSFEHLPEYRAVVMPMALA